MSENLYYIKSYHFNACTKDTTYICWSEIGKPDISMEGSYWDFDGFYPQDFDFDIDDFRGFVLDKVRVNEEGEECGEYSWSRLAEHEEWPRYFYERDDGERIPKEKGKKAQASGQNVTKIKFFAMRISKFEEIKDSKLAKAVKKYFKDTDNVALVIDERDTKAIRQILEGCVVPRNVRALIPYTGQGWPLYEYRDIIAKVSLKNEECGYWRNSVCIERTPLLACQITLGKVCGPEQMNLVYLTHFLTTDWDWKKYFSCDQDDTKRLQSYLMCLIYHNFDELFPAEALRTYTPLNRDEMFNSNEAPLLYAETYLDYGGLTLTVIEGNRAYTTVGSKDLVPEEMGDLTQYHKLFIQHYLLSKFLDRWIEIVKTAIGAGFNHGHSIATWSATISAVLKHDLHTHMNETDKISWYSMYATEENQKFFEDVAVQCMFHGGYDADFSNILISLMKPEHTIWGVREFLEPFKDHYSIQYHYNEFIKSLP